MKMTDARVMRLVLYLLCIVFAVSTVMSYLRLNQVHACVFRYGPGWGYDIFYKEKKIIHQPYMPAVQGNCPFPDRRSARKVGRHVATKIKAGDSPAVNAEEISLLMPGYRL